MNRLLITSITGFLASLAFTATAATTAVPDFNNAQGTIVIAQAQALNDYQMYLDRMMDESTMEMLDMNNDGEITRKEFMQFHRKVFENADKNKDGKLMKNELTRKDEASG